MSRDYIFFAGRRIAWRDSSGNVYYYFADVLGSTRAVTDGSGSTCFSADYYPYGQEIDYTTSCSPTYKFTGYEFDSETGNYYAYTRYYSPRLGRFMSPDLLAGNLLNPQSLNRYAYVLNNPESFIDPLGLDPVPCTITLPNGTTTQGLCTTTTQNTPKGDLTDFFRFLGEAGPNGCGPYGCPKPPPPDSILYAMMAGLSQRLHNHPAQQKQTSAKKGLFACASDAAESVSIAADLHKIPGLKSGVGGFVANALGGNPFSGATDLITSFATGEGGGHNVFYNMALADAAGPTQGFGPLFGRTIEGTPWAAGPTDAALGLLGEYATGVGEANFVFSGITYLGSFAGCGFGVIH